MNVKNWSEQRTEGKGKQEVERKGDRGRREREVWKVMQSDFIKFMTFALPDDYLGELL